MKKLRVLLFILFLPAAITALGQRLHFERLSDKDGLGNTSITSILKDSYGYMWFGTFNGLSRYDGYTFTNYLNDPKNDQSLTDNRVRFLLESGDRTLIIGLRFGGICLYNRETETFIRLRHDPKKPSSLSHDHVLAAFEDHNGNIWIGTRSGLDKFDLKTRTFTHYNPPNAQSYFVSAISEDKEGNLWLYGTGHIIYKFNPRTNTYENVALLNNFTYDNSASWGSDLKFDSKGNLWIGTEGYGLCRYNPASGEKTWFSRHNNKLTSDFVFSIIEDVEGKIWIGTDGGGLYRYDYTSNSIVNYRHDPNDLNSLSSNAIYYVYESEPGTLWAGAYAAGINVFKKFKNKFTKFSSTGLPPYCLSNKSVLSIREAGNGKIWLGTDGGGLNLLDPHTGTFTYYNTENSVIHSNIIKSIYVLNDHTLWLGSYGSGLAEIDFDKGKTKIFKGNIHGDSGKTILNDHVWAIKKSYDNKLWIGLVSFGINVYDFETKKFTYYPFDTAAFSKSVSTINVLFEDSKRRMWVGCETEGLGYFDPEKKEFVRFKYNGKPGRINSNDIRDIFEDSRGNLWIATFQAGLCKITDPANEAFECFTMKDGLPTNNIQNILEDDHHNLWLSTDKGITFFNLAEKKFINFDIDDGLQSKEFNFSSSLKSKDGYMYFGGIEGFNMFHPDSIRFNTVPPVVTITDFRIFNNSLHVNTPYNDHVYLTRAINMTREITLLPEDNIFSIDFAALDFNSPMKNKYAYRLKGFKDEWTYVSADKRFATYTNLDPGRYTFQVIASNNDGVWNNEGATLQIIVLPPWWMTWWFRTMAVSGIILLVIGFYYFRNRSIRQRNKFLETEVRKQTVELKQANDYLQERNEAILRQQTELEHKKQELEALNKTKDKFFSILGHDLKGPVKALTSLTGMMKEESAMMASEKQKMLANHIDASSRKIQNLILNLLEWARAQSGKVKTEPVSISATRLLRENMELLSEQASQKQIEVKIALEQEVMIWGDYNMICTVVRNILSNSIKYTPKGGQITLSAIPAGSGEVKISITDTGIGMSEEILSKLFTLEKQGSVKGTDNETGTGLGMLIAKEFTEVNKGRIHAESAPGKGSTFSLTLPLSNDFVSAS